MIAADPALCGAFDPPARPIDTMTAKELNSCAVLALHGPTAWARLRALRVGGLRVGAIVVGADPPEDRVLFEPVAVVAGAHALADAVRSLQRQPAAGPIRLPGGVVDPNRSQFARNDGSVVPLTALETRLVTYLATRAGRAVDRDELQLQVWEHAKTLETKTVDMTVARLRKKIEPDPSHPVSILTVRGGGYRAVPAVEAPQRAVPQATGAFFGRDDLVDELLLALRPGAALGIFGPPGVGKSRLGLALLARWPHRARHLDLDGRAGELGAALAMAAGIAGAEDPLAVFVEGITPEELLVVDHGDSLDPASLLAHLAPTGARLVWLSRRLPAVAGLVPIALPPLTRPDAVAMLRHHARVPVSDVEAEALVERLDHLPLAIDLAAPRIAALGCAGLRGALDEGGGTWLSGTGVRHGSLDGTIGWSVGRLDPATRAVLAGLTHFVGTFSAEDAAAVTGGYLGVATLAQESLLASDGRNLRLLHAVRDHARRADAPAVAATRPAYTRRITAFARSALLRLGTFEAQEVFSALTARLPDLWRALELTRDPVEIADLTHAIDRVFQHTGTAADRAALLESSARRVAGTGPPEGIVLLRQVILAGNQTDTLTLLERVAELAGADTELVFEARERAARSAWWSTGPATALSLLFSVDPNLLSPVNRLRHDAAVTVARMQLGELTTERACERLATVSDDLLAEGAVALAATVLIDVAARWIQTAPGRARPRLEQQAAWSGLGHDLRLHVELLNMLASEQYEAGEHAAAHASLARAETIAARVARTKVTTIRAKRSQVFTSEGRTDDARALLLPVREDYARRGTIMGEFDAIEQLVALEMEAGRDEAALAWAWELTALAERSANPHLVQHGRLALVGAALGADGLAEARLALGAIEPERLSAWGQAQFLHYQVIAALCAGESDPALWRRLQAWRDDPAPVFPQLRPVVAAALVQDGAAIAPFLSPAREPLVEVRILARLYRGTCRGPGNTT